MSDWPHTVNSEPSWLAFVAKARKVYDETHYATFSEPRIGPDRSLDQNSLFQVWSREAAAYIASKHTRDVTEEEFESMKRKMKHAFYSDTGSPWMILKLTDPLTGESRPEFRSSAKYGRGEMFEFLTWIQMFWAKLGLVLESKGEYAALVRKQTRT
jgi:hypothetical protein